MSTSPDGPGGLDRPDLPAPEPRIAAAFAEPAPEPVWDVVVDVILRTTAPRRRPGAWYGRCVAELRDGVLGRGASVGAIDLTYADFERLVSQGNRVLINFSADWCPASREFMPIFEQASRRHREVVFGKVDTAVHRELVGVMEITAIPTVIAVYRGTLLYRESGVHEPELLDQVVAQLLRVQ